MALGGLLLLAAGCRSGQLPDPNAPDRIAAYPDVMARNIADLRDRLEDRVRTGEISREQQEKLISELRAKYLKTLNGVDIEPEQAWIVGDMLRDAGNWKEALRLFDIARKAAKTEDRRVNDTLRWARCAAHLGQVKEAISAARTTFNAPPEEKAPILPAVLYEVVEAGRGKGQDAELAKLMEEAVEQHLKTKVDHDSPAGKAFLAARPVHLTRAWSQIAALYQSAGQGVEARAALVRGNEMMARYGQF